ncbi:LppU/SCO3897 family protein [Bailinhaonella thermotolerans]|uniref:Uncharacterized protein n=1 Tax=Bailinhaonella thermotolerans TaxID=1070861 RepID=A0A3A4ATQ6_9ACTN|nr:hypothetical protein [Bailinhaonella thermotolerans]RJL33370.1 hypothetical protein D5H75_11295 [Bailinhaonella thermotolerans]
MSSQGSGGNHPPRGRRPPPYGGHAPPGFQAPRPRPADEPPIGPPFGYGPPAGIPYPDEPERRPGRRRALLLAVVVTAVVVAVAATAVLLMARGPGGDDPRVDALATSSHTPTPVLTPPSRWAVGACVRPEAVGTAPPSSPAVPQTDQDFLLAHCSDPQATGRVTSMLDESEPLTEPACPEDTDEAIMVGAEETACVRNLREPHPGDPGRGGGVLRAGDCVADPNESLGGERPCGDSGWYGKVVGRAEKASECPDGTQETLRMRGSPRPIVCLGDEGEVVSKGDCIRSLKKYGKSVPLSAVEKVDCGSKDAWAKVTARVKKRGDCPKGTDQYLESRDEDAYRPVTCLRDT